METRLKTVKKPENPGARSPRSVTSKPALAALLGSPEAASLAPLMASPGTDAGPAPERSEKQIRQRFYYLHEQLKKRYKVDVKTKTIFVDDFERIPAPYSDYIEELKGSGYAIQKSLVALVPDASIGKQKIKQIARLFAGQYLAHRLPPFSGLENISEADLKRLEEEIRAIGKDLVESVTLTPPDGKYLQDAINHVLNIKPL